MALLRWDPFSELDALSEQMNNLLKDTVGQSALAQLTPVTDIYKKDDGTVIIEAHLPNFSEDEVHVTTGGGVLEVRAEHSAKDETKDKRSYLVRESSGHFYRRLSLPAETDQDNITAAFEKGVLKITLPLKNLPAPKKIAISSGKPLAKKTGAPAKKKK